MGLNISLRVEGKPWDTWQLEESHTEALLVHCGIDLPKALAPTTDGINRKSANALLVTLFQEEEKMAARPATHELQEQRDAIGNVADMLFRFWQITLDFPGATLQCVELISANQAA